MFLFACNVMEGATSITTTLLSTWGRSHTPTAHLSRVANQVHIRSCTTAHGVTCAGHHSGTSLASSAPTTPAANNTVPHPTSRCTPAASSTGTNAASLSPPTRPEVGDSSRGWPGDVSTTSGEPRSGACELVDRARPPTIPRGGCSAEVVAHSASVPAHCSIARAWTNGASLTDWRRRALRYATCETTQPINQNEGGVSRLTRVDPTQWLPQPLAARLAMHWRSCAA